MPTELSAAEELIVTTHLQTFRYHVAKELLQENSYLPPLIKRHSHKCFSLKPGSDSF
jgi:hypothetical protein